MLVLEEALAVLKVVLAWAWRTWTTPSKAAVGKLGIASACELAVAFSAARTKVLSPGIRHHQHQVQAQATEGSRSWLISKLYFLYKHRLRSFEN